MLLTISANTISRKTARERTTPVALWKKEKTELNWGLYIKMCGDKGLYMLKF
jgi:hypothetical protein